MKVVPYALALGSLMYAILCNRPDNYYIVGLISRYQSNLEPEHWTKVKHIFKYLRQTRDHMLIYRDSYLILLGYTNFILCQTWILENQLLYMCSQGLRAHKTKTHPIRESMA